MNIQQLIENLTTCSEQERTSINGNQIEMVSILNADDSLLVGKEFAITVIDWCGEDITISACSSTGGGAAAASYAATGRSIVLLKDAIISYLNDSVPSIEEELTAESAPIITFIVFDLIDNWYELGPITGTITPVNMAITEKGVPASKKPGK